MSYLINVYSTLRETPPLEFPHTLNSRRDRSDSELTSHLHGFMGYVMSKASGQLSQTVYALYRHIERVQHHLSVTIEEEAIDAFADWAVAANAVLFLPDGSVRDPAGAMLLNPATGQADDNAILPYPIDAQTRKAFTTRHLQQRGLAVPATLPPIIGEPEATVRPASDVAARTLALFAVAVRAESLVGGNPIPVERLRERLPLAFQALTPDEARFLALDKPETQDIIQFTWRYEALATLQWALKQNDTLPFPTDTCEVPRAAKTVLEVDPAAFLRNASLRPTSELLDALDLHVRLHWIVRQAQLSENPPPGGLEPGVIQERHYALNWLMRFEDAEWDRVTTPT